MIDVSSCPIATDGINNRLPRSRASLFKLKKKRGGTLLLRETLEGVVEDPNQLVTEKVNDLIFQFKAGEFFQNNPLFFLYWSIMLSNRQTQRFVLPLVDAYCGGGLFSLSASKSFQKVIGIEISRDGFEGAKDQCGPK